MPPVIKCRESAAQPPMGASSRPLLLSGLSSKTLASVTPGNARSLRFFLRHGFVPLGSEQLWKPSRLRPVV